MVKEQAQERGIEDAVDKLREAGMAFIRAYAEQHTRRHISGRF